MSLVWLVLTGNTPAIIATLICLQTMKFFQRTGFGDSKTFLCRLRHEPYMMGLGQGNRAAPPSWIQLSAVLVNVYKQLSLGTDLHDPITDERIHSMGAMYVDDLDMYTWKDEITDPVELMLQAQQEKFVLNYNRLFWTMHIFKNKKLKTRVSLWQIDSLKLTLMIRITFLQLCIL